MTFRKHAGLAALVIGASLCAHNAGLAQTELSFGARSGCSIPLAPGGAIDVMVRALGKAFEQRNPAGFVVESRPGANTIIAANACKAAPPDGSTICLLSRSTVSINPALYKNLSYDPLKDFEPITNIAFAQQVLILNKSVPVKDFKELVAYSKQHPDKLNFGSFGVGGDSHLIIEWLKHETGAKLDAYSLQRRVRGHARVQGRRRADDVSDRRQSRSHPPDQRGRGQGLLVPGSKRNPLVPDVPSFAEAGLPPHDSTYVTWFGMFAPKGTPAAIVGKLNAELAAIVKTPAFAEQFLFRKASRRSATAVRSCRGHVEAREGNLVGRQAGAK